MANGEIMRKGLRAKKSKYGNESANDWEKEDKRRIREARRIKDSVNFAPIVDGQMEAAPFELADAGFNWKDIGRGHNNKTRAHRDYIAEQNRVAAIIGEDAPAPVIAETEPEAIVIEVN